MTGVVEAFHVIGTSVDDDPGELVRLAVGSPDRAVRRRAVARLTKAVGEFEAERMLAKARAAA